MKQKNNRRSQLDFIYAGDLNPCDLNSLAMMCMGVWAWYVDMLYAGAISTWQYELELEMNLREVFTIMEKIPYYLALSHLV